MSAKSTFKIIHSGWYVVRIDLFQLINYNDKNVLKNSTVNYLEFRNIFLNWSFLNKSMLASIISFLELYWISYSFLIYLQISSNSSNVVPENVCEQWDITETKNWIRLFSMIKVNFYFLNLFLNNCRIFTTFFVVVIEYIFEHWLSKSSLKNEQSMRI